MHLEVLTSRPSTPPSRPRQAWKQSPEPDEADSQADLITVQVVVSAKGRRGAPTSMEEAEAERMLCYRVLEALHKVLPARDPSANFRDFVRYPRDNGYQALHSLVDLQGFPYPIEVHVSPSPLDSPRHIPASPSMSSDQATGSTISPTH
jgi:hypothetical protein